MTPPPEVKTSTLPLWANFGFVYLIFVDGAHAITCFNTIDHGLIYIEPQNDEVVTVGIGQQYSGYVITDLGIIW